MLYRHTYCYAQHHHFLVREHLKSKLINHIHLDEPEKFCFAYIHTPGKKTEEGASFTLFQLLSVYSTCFKGTLVFYLYFCSNGVFVLQLYFFQLILLFLKHTFLSFETLSTAPWCPQNAAEMSPQLPFPLLCHARLPFFFTCF